MPLTTQKKPTALKLLEGNPGKRPLPKDEPQPAVVMPKCPGWLSKEAKRKWKELAPKLHRLGLLTELDSEKLAAMCMHWSLMVDAAKDIKARGSLVPAVKDPDALIRNPSLQSLRENSVAFTRYAAEFGMDPQNRTKISAKPVIQKDDVLEKMLSKPKR